MAREFAEDFYRSSAWKKTRAAFAKSKLGICERCGGVGEIVHHKIYLTPKNISDPNISLDWNNLELLCQECHNREHFGESEVREGLTFDENGQLVAVGSPPVK